MKKILYTLFVFSTLSISAQGKKFFETGEVQLKNKVEKINLRFENDLPFVKVNINGKSYNFLFDTGAPTVISNAVYTELGLEKKHKSKIKDSQKNKQSQIFTELPEMIVDQVIFKNIGVVVMDFTVSELGCFKVDGILGANQMAKLFWRINYTENILEATKDLSQFNLEGYETVINFEAKPQKTPIVLAKMLDKKIEFTFDTGFSGRLKIADSYYDSKKVKQVVETFGSSSVGAFGAGKPVQGFVFRTDIMELGNNSFVDELVTTGSSNLIGNDFFKNFVFVLDWTNNRVYMKNSKKETPKLESFGFGYRFVDARPVVAFVFQEENFPLKIGDSIISINNVDLDHLDKDSACHYFINRVEKDQNTIDVKIKRDGKILDVKLNKKEYLNS
ncbi:aspartyl protease family protein [Chryseobacterium sp. JUb7]|uniref:aspartyl protease family protein n=1 Tax=Chryseobacterium sp. JUb7 TaxID=2940599 RepID=UPI002168C5DC|nr:aspartyl protease family protein [Chryseobacterium sp. JUb7]MCS3529264.1 putative aspartyl protease [Chryseobacterium sp. JUb7]